MTPTSRLALPLAAAGGFTLAPPLASSAVPQLDLISVAHAADFTGKIKRIRIKKKRLGGNFKVVARTQSSSSANRVGTTVTTAFEPTDGGPALQTQVASTPTQATVRYTATVDLPFGEGEPTLDVFVNHPGGTTSSATLTLAAGARAGWTIAEGAGDTLRVDAAWIDGDEPGSSRVRLFVRGQDADWDPSTLTAVEAVVSLDDGVLSAAPSEDRVNDRFVTTLVPPADPTGFTYAVTTTVTDEAGAVLDTQTETVVVGADDITPVGPAGVRASERGNGTAKIRVTTRTGADFEQPVQIALTDAVTGEVVLDETLTTPTERIRMFGYPDMEFASDESPVGRMYLVLVDLLDAEGTPIGGQREIEVRMLGADEPAQAGRGAADDGMGDVGVMLYEQEDGAVGAWVQVNGTALDVGGVQLTFEEPFEGPPPLETEVTLEAVQTISRWSTTSAVGAPDLGVLTISDGNGSVSGTVELPETLGRLYGNGKGTRKASTVVVGLQIPLL